MSNETEIKSLIEAGNKQIAALREATETKADADKVARIEADLAKTLEAKSALEARLEAIETANARANVLAGKGADTAEMEAKDAFLTFLRKPEDYNRKSAYEELSRKSINTATPADGGVAVPLLISQNIIKTVINTSPIRQLARVVTVGTPNYREIVAGEAATGWAGETDTRTVTTTPTFTAVEPSFGEAYAVAEVSNHALNDVFFDVESFLTERIGEGLAAREGNAFVSGTGVDQPLGLLAAGSNITNIKTGVAAALSANPFDQLIDMVFAVKAAHRANGTFLMNSVTEATLSKVKDSEGRYLYTPSLAAGVPATLLGYRVATDEGMPAIAANARPILFGDLSKYLIADVAGMSLITDSVTRKGYTQFYVSRRVGGAVALPEAFKALQVAV